MNPFKLLKPSYLFDPTPSPDFALFWPCFIFFILVFAASWKINSCIIKQKHPRIAREYLGGIVGRTREFAILGLVLTFFRDQNIPYLGARYLLVLLVLAYIAYGVWVWKSYKKGLETELNVSSKKAEVDKYKPQPKKKRKKKR